MWIWWMCYNIRWYLRCWLGEFEEISKLEEKLSGRSF